MPAFTDTAICIRRWDFSETSQTVSLFTREHGVIRGIAKGAKREKGNFSGGIDLLTRGQIVALARGGDVSRSGGESGLATLTNWNLEEVYRAIRSSLPANRAALYVADLLHHMLKEADPHPRLFDAFDEALLALADRDRIELTLLTMQWSILCETGYQPELHRNAETGAELPAKAATLAFSPGAGGIVDDVPGPDRWRVRMETIELLRAIAAGSGDGTPVAAARANRLLASYIREILGVEPPAMRWAFSEGP